MSNRNQLKRWLGDAGENAPATISTLYDDAEVAAEEELEEDLWSQTSRCEQSTANAIRNAQPARKLSAFDSGIKEWKRALSESATRYYNTCFELALKSLADLGGNNAADFAYRAATTRLSVFLRLSTLDVEKTSP